jgi:hypothetical protein
MSFSPLDRTVGYVRAAGAASYEFLSEWPDKNSFHSDFQNRQASSRPEYDED